jgi:hypothetical protein
MRWFYLLLLCGAGLFLLVVAVTSGARRRALQRRGVRAKGTVVEIFKDPSRHGATYYPVVEFPAADGRTRRFQSSSGSSQPEYEKGSRVDVIYDRDDPSVAEFAGFEAAWGGTIAAAVLGVICLAAGAGIFYVAGSYLAR